MKKILTICLLIMNVFGADIMWSDSYYNALTQGKKDKKVVWVLITKDSCKWCHKFEVSTLKDDEIIEKINKDFKSVHITKERGDIPPNLNPTMFPYNYFIDSTSGKVIDSYPGYLNVESFNEVLDDAVVSFKKNNH